MIRNKALGSMLIIAGTSIGAGMLALPIASAGLGFITSVILLVVFAGLMTYTALLMLEVHQYADPGATLNTLSKTLLGKSGQIVANVSIIFLFYSLCAAYISGGGEQLQVQLGALLGAQVAPQTGAIIFAILIAIIVGLGAGAVDKITRVLFTLKIIALAALFYLLTPEVNGQYLLAMPIEQGLIVTAVPIVFTAFGFHGSIPSVVRYVGLDVAVLRKVLMIGATLPLLLYVLWQLVSQGSVSQTNLANMDGLSGFVSSLSTQLNNSNIGNFINVFANLALATSFIGVGLGLFDFIRDSLKQGDSNQGRITTALLTFMPPLCFALFYPKGFITALGFGAIALVVLAIFLPVAMVNKQRKLKARNSETYGYKVTGGTPALIVAVCFGIGIISAQLFSLTV